MPFKLRLKKSRHYRVASKSLFVVSVELLDSNTIECTLTSESTGRECLENVCQRLGLQQGELFGLRYVKRGGGARWVEMKRPVKKQLDKYARDPNLYLRLMYYINNVSLLHDETTRYHYFLQLKMDVMEGKIRCSPNHALMLASYSMQAEFGDHDPLRHTIEYLKEIALFPKEMQEGEGIEKLAAAVMVQHSRLTGLPQSKAEHCYILVAQQLDRYGQEVFQAKDEGSRDVEIGVCLSGIAIHHDNGTTTKFYAWKDITNVVNHKRYFGIECQEPGENCQFHLPDVETAKYIWRMCVNQHTFFMQNESASAGDSSTTTASSLRNIFSQLTLEESNLGGIGSSYEDLDNDRGHVPGSRLRAAQSCLDLPTNHIPHDIENLRSLLPEYRAAPDYETAIQLKYRPILYSSQPDIHQYPDVTRVERYTDGEGTIRGGVGLHTYSTPDLERSGGVVVRVLKPPPPYPRPNSTPDLASPPNAHHHFNQHLDESGGSNNIMYYVRTGGSGGALSGQALSTHNQSISANQGVLSPPTLVAPSPAVRHHFNQPKSNSASEPIYENIPVVSWGGANDSISNAGRPSTVSAPPDLTDQPSPQVVSEPAPTRQRTTSHHNSSIDSSRSTESGTLGKALKTRGIKWASLLSGGRNKSSTHVTPPANPPPTLSKEALCQLLEMKLADSQLFFEFEKIPKQKNNPKFTTAQLPENMPRNRSKEVFPYEESRVMLTPYRENKYGYVNASHITATIGLQQRFYIAAESPMSSTVSEFWQLVWECGVYLIVSLGSPSDELSPYLPIPDHLLHTQNFEVVWQLGQETGHCLASKLRLTHIDSGSTRALWHLRYSELGLHHCPNTVPHFLGFLEEVSSVRQQIASEVPASVNRNPPVLVHCTDGAGPTAVTIASDLLLQTIDHNQEVDIARLVWLLRQQRPRMIQNISQYRFIHSLIIYYLNNSRLI